MIRKNPSFPYRVNARLMKTAAKFAPGLSAFTGPATGATDQFDILKICGGYPEILAAGQQRRVSGRGPFANRRI